MRFFTQGFSLIELMIVIAIISILAVIAVPSYQNYTQRARFAEVIAATEPFKTAISLALQQDVPLSELTNSVHGIPPSPPPTKNLSNLIVENGVITATGTHTTAGAILILTPNIDGSNWTISGSCVNAGLCND